MKKIGFVIPWFGMNIPGGAESEFRELTKHLADSGSDLEILTTCVEKFSSDWNKNYHKEGIYVEAGMTVRRFPVRKRNTKAFDDVNNKLMHNQLPNEAEEEIFFKESVNSPRLYEYIKTHSDEYELFVFMPYMFGTTFYGAQINPEKTVVIPCLHDESYIYMKSFDKVFSKVSGMVFLSKLECELAKRVYDLSSVNAKVLGAGVDTEISGNAESFRKKFNIHDDFILYAGRKDAGKKVDTLIQYYCEYKKRTGRDAKLVLIGGGSIVIPDIYKSEILDLGFVDKQDKYNAYAAATLLCQPSFNESFSIVIMESWLSGIPVLVAEQCAVTTNFCKESNGGLWFKDYFDFEYAVEYIFSNPAAADTMGFNGCEFVKNNFSWDVVVDKYKKYFKEIAVGT